MNTNPTDTGAERAFGKRWVAAAGVDQIRDLAQALAHSPHAEAALNELLGHADVIGTYYSRADMEGGVTERLEAIEDRLGRTLTDREFDALVGQAWAHFAAGGVPGSAYDVFCEDLYVALWDQIDTLPGRAAYPPVAADETPPEPGPTTWETVNPAASSVAGTLLAVAAPARGVAAE